MGREFNEVDEKITEENTEKPEKEKDDVSENDELRENKEIEDETEDLDDDNEVENLSKVVDEKVKEKLDDIFTDEKMTEEEKEDAFSDNFSFLGSLGAKDQGPFLKGVFESVLREYVSGTQEKPDSVSNAVIRDCEAKVVSDYKDVLAKENKQELREFQDKGKEKALANYNEEFSKFKDENSSVRDKTLSSIKGTLEKDIYRRLDFGDVSVKEKNKIR